jgi:hypothetical protein
MAARKIGPATCRAKSGEVAPSQEQTGICLSRPLPTKLGRSLSAGKQTAPASAAPGGIDALHRKIDQRIIGRGAAKGDRFREVAATAQWPRDGVTACRPPDWKCERQIRDVPLFLLNYRHPNGRFAGAAVFEASALISARMAAVVYGLNDRLVFASGHELDAESGRQVPESMIGRLLDDPSTATGPYEETAGRRRCDIGRPRVREASDDKGDNPSSGRTSLVRRNILCGHGVLKRR